MVGRAAEVALPHLAREIDEARNTTQSLKLKRAIVTARLQRAQAKGDSAALQSALASFWRGESGDTFQHDGAEQRLRLFREHHAGIVDALADHLRKTGLRMTRLVEIGCGNGQVLAEVAGRLPDIATFVGLDINAAIVARNSADQPAGSRFSFLEADAGAWLAATPQPGTIVLSNGGVLEYFSQASFDSLLQALSHAAPAAIMLIEPVAPGHDLSRQPDSFPFGQERSFSHNHRSRLTHAGFDIVFSEEKQVRDVRWMLMIGVRP